MFFRFKRLNGMADNASSVTDSQCEPDVMLLDPQCENVLTSIEPADMAVTVSSIQLPSVTIDGPPCSMLPVAGNAALLPASCVVEDDEPVTGQRRHHHHRHYRRHRGSGRRRHRLCRVKWKEVNFMATMLNVVAAVLVCTSLAEPRWWYISGSPCLDHDQRANFLGVSQFVYKGFFVDSTSGTDYTNKYYYGTLQNEGEFGHNNQPI